jgi:hypothetical protein
MLCTNAQTAQVLVRRVIEHEHKRTRKSKGYLTRLVAAALHECASPPVDPNTLNMYRAQLCGFPAQAWPAHKSFYEHMLSRLSRLQDRVTPVE